MKKMLAKAVVLGLVLGGIGFVANDALAAEIGPAVKVETGLLKWEDVLGYEDGKKINAEAEAAAKAAGEAKAAAGEAKTVATAAQTTANAAKDAADAAQTTANAAKDAADAAQTTANAAKDAAAKNADDIKTNSTAISAETEARIKADDELDKKIGENTKAINNEVTERKAEVARLDGEVARLDSKIDKLDARVEKVGAMAAAIANLHTMGYDPEAPTEIAVGVGQYRDKTGMALGAFHYPNRDFMLSFSVSTAGDEYMGGIGATWKFGRKTPEELRQAEAEKAAKAKLAKAEAAKKAAKDARVAAQQKRHAEMLAARTAK